MRSNGEIKAPRLQSAPARFAGRSSRRFYPSIRRPQAVEQCERRFSLPARHGIQPFSFEGGGGGKSPESMGYGSFYSRKIWNVPAKNLRALTAHLYAPS